ncbi:alpha/beta fold hydrolase [Thermodesulfobacteriota bacterium]
MPLIKINQLSIYYESIGRGKAIVFLHGFTGSGKDWHHQMAAIGDSYRGIVLDLRGHGKSEAPDREEGYSIYLNCEDVRGLLAEHGIHQCCLVGHSMGGFTALQFALENPEMLCGLVLVDTSSGEWDTAPGYADLRAKLDELARTEGLEAAFEYDAENNPVRIDRFQKQPEQKEIARTKTLGTAIDAYVYVPRSFLKWQPVTKRLDEIKVPTIIFRGEHDTGFIRASNILKENIAGSKLIIVPDAYHNPHEEASGFFNEHLLAFLSRIN